MTCSDFQELHSRHNLSRASKSMAHYTHRGLSLGGLRLPSECSCLCYSDNPFIRQISWKQRSSNKTIQILNVILVIYCNLTIGYTRVGEGEASQRIWEAGLFQDYSEGCFRIIANYTELFCNCIQQDKMH